MNLLILNVGSSTVKWAVFEHDAELMRGTIDKIDAGDEAGEKGVEKALNEVCACINNAGVKAGKNAGPDWLSKDLDAVVHRVAHGGMQKNSTIITSKVLKDLKTFSSLAPLHDVPEIRMIEQCSARFDCPQIAVFDTAFHQSMPEHAWRYALPREWTDRYKVRRFGFHGLSHKFLAEAAPKILKKQVPRLISCHIGSGVSITAIKDGKSVDTSMGWTPLEGAVMGSRCGDIDPAIPVLMMGKAGVTVKELNKVLNSESGMLALCGEQDMRKILNRKDKRAKLAVKIFCFRIKKYIGSYAAGLGGLDAIAFTGGIGEHSWKIRRDILDGLQFLGVRTDSRKNKENKVIISSGNSRVDILVVPTDEETMMVQEARRILK